MDVYSLGVQNLQIGIEVLLIKKVYLITLNRGHLTLVSIVLLIIDYQMKEK